MTAPQAENTVIMAKIGAPVGTDGTLKLHYYGEDPQDLLQYQSQLLIQHQNKSPWQNLNGHKIFFKGNKLAIRFASCTDRDIARNQYTHALLAVLRSDLPDISDEGSYYWHDLKGLKVLDQNHKDLGTINDIFETGANDIIVVSGIERILIPYTKDYITKVDLKTGTIHVFWEGYQD